MPSDEPLSLENPALLVSDAGHMPASMLEALHGRCRAAGRPLAIVAPSPSAALLEAARGPGVVLFEATALPGQPASALLQDVAMCAEATFHSKHLGWTLDFGAEECPPLVLPVSWVPQVEDLGHLQRLEYTPGRLTLIARAQAAGTMRLRAEGLARVPVTSDPEDAGMRRRLERLGAPAAATRRAAAPSFEQTDAALRLPAGFLSPYFITDGGSLEARLTRPDVVVSGRPLSAWRDVAALLRSESGGARSSPLLLVVPALADEALALLVVNKLRGIVEAVAIEVADGSWLDAVAGFSGARPTPQAFDPQARMGSVASAVCDARSVTLVRH